MAGGAWRIRVLLCSLIFGSLAEVGADTPDIEHKQETPEVRRWREYNYTGTESIDVTSLEDVFHPLILTSEVQGDNVKITMTYSDRITSTPFWQFKFDGVSFISTQGLVVRNGSRTSTNIDLPVFWNNNHFLTFSISSDIGTYYIELDFDFLRREWVDMSVPRAGFKMVVPKTFNGTEFLVKVENSEKATDDYCFKLFTSNALLRCVDDKTGSVERLLALGVHTKEKTDMRVVKEYGMRDVYHGHVGEVVVFSYCTSHNDVLDTYGVFKDTKFVKYSKRNNTADTAVNKTIAFVDGIYGTEDVMHFDETFPYRSVSCEAFGYIKPVVTIQHEDGRLLPTVELKQSSGMTSHVIASLDDIALGEAVGKYICTATAGNKMINKTIEVERVVRPEILMAEVVVNNTEEIIAICIARGQPTPNVSFSVNYAKDDEIEKRPVLETEHTVKIYHTSKYKRTGGLSTDRWFKDYAERCPKPESVTMNKFENNLGVTQQMIAVKPLPYLSRRQVDLLYCRADGYDDVYVTKEITAKISRVLNKFMTFANTLSFTKVFG